MMLGNCNDWVHSSIKFLFKSLLKNAFVQRFGYVCPRTLCTVRDLSFLPHLLSLDMPWRLIRVQQLQAYLEIPYDEWEKVLRTPTLAAQEYPKLTEVGNNLLDYRLQVNQAIPTRLKSLFAWNINSWSIPKSSRQDQKMRRCKKLLRSGPVRGILVKKRCYYNTCRVSKSPPLQLSPQIGTPPQGEWPFWFQRVGQLHTKQFYFVEEPLRHSYKTDRPPSTLYHLLAP